MALQSGLGGFLGKLKDLVFGKGKVTRLFDALQKDPGNMDLTRQIQQAFSDKPISVITEVVRRASEARDAKEEPPPLSVGIMRQTWQNTIKTEKVQPLKLFSPKTKADLVAIVKEAEATGFLVRAVGCGHSFSDVANATDYQVNMLTLQKTLAVETDTLKPGFPALYSCEAGALVQKVNAELDAMGLALHTMAAFDQETIYGAIATSTHGTGIRVDGMAAMVRSMDLVAAGGKSYRLEPTTGITDPVRFASKYADGSLTLIQDDDMFFSAVVGFGLMGIVYSLVIAPVPAFYLRQQLWVSTWDKVKPKLADRSFFVDTTENGDPVVKDSVTGQLPPTRAQVFVNPYITRNFLTKKDANTCVVQVQQTITKAEYDQLKSQQQRQPKSKLLDFLLDILTNGKQGGVHEASINGEDKDSLVEELGIGGLLFLLNSFPTLTPLFIDISLIVLLSGNGKYGKGFIVMNQGKLAIKDSGYSVEPGLPVDSKNTFIKGAEEIIRVATVSAASMGWLTAPFCMRFVKASEDYMSPEYQQDTCMTDVPLMLGTVGEGQMFDRMQVDLLEIGARPHWGKICNLVNGPDLLKQMYPKFDTFKKTVQFFNPNGTFNSRFSMRTGITPVPFGVK
jgi:L-gulono-1,4-lactone dehydrogenase